MPDVPQKVVVDRVAEKLLIDGQEFPWLITDDGPTVSAAGFDKLPTVTVTFFAPHVEVVERQDPAK